MTKRITLTSNDLKVIKQLLDDEYTRLCEGLADPADIAEVIIPLVKVTQLIMKAGN
jgi:hypothetical protein